MRSTTSLQGFKAEFFRALGHPLRIRILEVLGAGDHSVQELQQILEVEQPVMSQQLAVLRGKNIVRARKEGTSVRYALGDRLITKLLEVAKDIFNNQFADSQAMLKELQRERRR